MTGCSVYRDVWIPTVSSLMTGCSVYRDVWIPTVSSLMTGCSVYRDVIGMDTYSQFPDDRLFSL